MRTSSALIVSLAALSGCVRESTALPCDAEGRCLPGYACVEAQCTPCALDECPTSQITLVSDMGGRACGADDTCVRFAPGALRDAVEIEVARTTDVPTNVDGEVVAKLFVVRPVYVVPEYPFEIAMTVSRAVVPSQRVRIHTALDPRGPWTALDTARDGQRVTAGASKLGFFTVALAPEVVMEADAGSSGPPDAAPPPPVDPVAGLGRLMTIPGGVLGSLHGIAWDSAGGRLLLADTDTSEVYAIPHTAALPGQPVRFRSQSNRTYGLAVDGLGRAFMAEHGSRSVSRLDERGALSAVATAFEGRRFNGPTDVALRSEGTVYFTDPSTGLAGQPRELEFNGLFRRSTGGALTAEWQGSPESEPRGVELSPDERVLYLTDTATRAVLAFDVATDGALSAPRIFARTTGVQPDGIAVDRLGNVYVGTQAGIEVYAPDGTPWGQVETPTPVGGLTFGGPGLQWLYAASPGQVLLTTVTVSGAR